MKIKLVTLENGGVNKKYVDKNASIILKDIGIVETTELIAAVTCVDVAINSANVKLIGYEYAKGDLRVAIKIKGDIGAVQAAVSAAEAVMYEKGISVVSLVIPRPNQETNYIIKNSQVINCKIKPRVTVTKLKVNDNKHLN